MARIHARRKGQSSSTHPVSRKKHPEWSSLNPREVESHVLELAKSGKSTSEIGLILRNLIRTSLQLKKHLEVHKKDLKNKRNLQLTESKIRRLTKYYHNRDRLPKGWKYSPEQAKLIFE